MKILCKILIVRRIAIDVDSWWSTCLFAGDLRFPNLPEMHQKFGIYNASSLKTIVLKIFIGWFESLATEGRIGRKKASLFLLSAFCFGP